VAAPFPLPDPVRTLDAVAHRVVSRCAPEEEVRYPVLRDDFFARGGVGARARDNPLGFGELVIGVVTGVVLAVLNELVTESLTETVRPWWQRAWNWAMVRLHLYRPPVADPGSPVGTLSPEQVPGVVAAVTRHALRAGIDPDRAAELARAIVEELTTLSGDVHDD